MLRAVTLAFGTCAPPGSLIVPTIVAVVICAIADCDMLSSNANTASRTTRDIVVVSNKFRIFISESSKFLPGFNFNFDKNL
jgi:hypothetical protein